MISAPIPRPALTLLLGLALVVPFARAQEEAEEEVAEYPQPDLVLTVTSGGKTTPVKPGEPVKVGDDKTSCEIVIDSVRHFDAEGVSFDYPGHYSYEFEQKEHQCWTMEGERAVLLLFRYPDSEDEAELFKSFHDNLAGQYGVDPKNSAKNSLALRNRTLQGFEIRGIYKEEETEQPITQEIFSFKSGGAVYILVLQDTPEAKSKDPTPEFRKLKDLVRSSFAIAE